MQCPMYCMFRVAVHLTADGIAPTFVISQNTRWLSLDLCLCTQALYLDNVRRRRGLKTSPIECSVVWCRHVNLNCSINNANTEAVYVFEQTVSHYRGRGRRKVQWWMDLSLSFLLGPSMVSECTELKTALHSQYSRALRVTVRAVPPSRNDH